MDDIERVFFNPNTLTQSSIKPLSIALSEPGPSWSEAPSFDKLLSTQNVSSSGVLNASQLLLMSADPNIYKDEDLPNDELPVQDFARTKYDVLRKPRPLFRSQPPSKRFSTPYTSQKPVNRVAPGVQQTRKLADDKRSTNNTSSQLSSSTHYTSSTNNSGTQATASNSSTRATARNSSGLHTGYDSDDDLFTQESRHSNSLARNNNFYTPQALTLTGVRSGDGANFAMLRPLEEIPDKYRAVFSFPYFNIVQSKIFDDVFYADTSLVICAPTGSGKTAVFELAIVRSLMKVTPAQICKIKIVYMAPVKALCSERYQDWKAKFEAFGLKCKELTGDTEIDDYFELQQVNIVLTTPEKWDSMTRKWRDNRSLVHLVTLFLIDEIHVMNDDTRGATMEAVISRMKAIQPAAMQTNNDLQLQAANIRFIAVSATIPNIEDVAEWLGDGESTAVFHKLDDSYRPVRLRKVVLGFACSEMTSDFKFDITLSYRLTGIIQTYSERKPTLVFCSTRKSVQQTAAILIKDAKFIMNMEHKQQLIKCSNMLKDSKLREYMLNGVGYHHAGMDMHDRKLIEEMFTKSQLPVLMATSTLCMGVNLPAHLVVIKTTTFYVMGVHQEYSNTQVLQMIGRAGRPQFDTSATAVIMTKNSTKIKYEALMGGTQLIESSLDQHLIEHLNAEIVLHTINDVSVAVEWLRSTFLYIRIMKNPKHYGLSPGLTKEQIEKKLQELCIRNLDMLHEISLIQMDMDKFDVKPTETGRLMARYCITYETMRRFSQIKGNESLQELLLLISNCKEFRDVHLRINEKKTLNTLNKDKNRMTIRYALDGKIKTKEMKINCLIQAQLGCLTVQDFGLSQDIGKIFRAGQRVTRSLVEFLWQRGDYQALLNAVLLCRSFKAKLWENSKYITRQLEGIGPMFSNAFVNAGILTFQKIEETNPRELELIVNRHPPFGNQIRDAAIGLPKYELSIEQLARYGSSVSEIIITITLVNKDQIHKKSTAGPNHLCTLIIGDSDNHVVYKARIGDTCLLKDGFWSKRLEVHRASKEDLQINFLSQDWVGLDVQSTYTPFYTGANKVTLAGQYNAKPSLTDQSGYFMHGKNEAFTMSANDPQGFSDGSKSRRTCFHKCLNKAVCAHDCCKNGIEVSLPKIENSQNMTIPRKAASSGNGGITNYMSTLKHRMMDYPTTPRRKQIKTSTTLQPMKILDLDKFSFTPKAQMSTVPQTPCVDVGQRTESTPSAAGWEHLDIYQKYREEYQINDDGLFEDDLPDLTQPEDSAYNRNSCPLSMRNEGSCQQQMNNDESRSDLYVPEDFQSTAYNQAQTYDDNTGKACNVMDTGHNGTSYPDQSYRGQGTFPPPPQRGQVFAWPAKNMDKRFHVSPSGHENVTNYREGPAVSPETIIISSQSSDISSPPTVRQRDLISAHVAVQRSGFQSAIQTPSGCAQTNRQLLCAQTKRWSPCFSDDDDDFMMAVEDQDQWQDIEQNTYSKQQPRNSATLVKTSSFTYQAFPQNHQETTALENNLSAIHPSFKQQAQAVSPVRSNPYCIHQLGNESVPYERPLSPNAYQQRTGEDTALTFNFFNTNHSSHMDEYESEQTFHSIFDGIF